jgi:hypothetical protein
MPAGRKMYSAAQAVMVTRYAVFNVLTRKFMPPFRDGGPIGGVRHVADAVMFSSYEDAETRANRKNPTSYLEWTLTGNKKEPWPFVSLKDQENNTPYTEVECSGPWIPVVLTLETQLPMFDKKDFAI